MDYRESKQNFNCRRCHKPCLPVFFRLDYGKAAQQRYTGI